MWGLLCQTQVSRTGTSNYIQRYLWDVFTCPCHKYLLLAHTCPQIYLGEQGHPWLRARRVTYWTRSHYIKQPWIIIKIIQENYDHSKFCNAFISYNIGTFLRVDKSTRMCWWYDLITLILWSYLTIVPGSAIELTRKDTGTINQCPVTTKPTNVHTFLEVR